MVGTLKGRSDAPEYQTAAKIMEDNPDFEIRRPRNLYKQTFWPDMQENLLDWDGSVTKEQGQQILRAAEEEADGPAPPRGARAALGANTPARRPRHPA